MSHLPECIPPDEVGARGVCVCVGNESESMNQEAARMGEKLEPFALPIRGVNTGAPKIRIEDANGITFAYVPYCNGDYGKQIKDTLAVARVGAIERACNQHSQLLERCEALRAGLEEVLRLASGEPFDAGDAGNAIERVARAALSQGKQS